MSFNPNWKESEGPWNGEPDEEEWEFQGLIHCRIVRHPELGHLNGYIDLPEAHPWRKLTENDLVGFVEVHGGVTYFNVDSVGFDCAHSGDICPCMGNAPYLGNNVYRDFAYVKNEVESMARQAIEAMVTP